MKKELKKVELENRSRSAERGSYNLNFCSTYQVFCKETSLGLSCYEFACFLGEIRCFDTL